MDIGGKLKKKINLQGVFCMKLIYRGEIRKTAKLQGCIWIFPNKNSQFFVPLITTMIIFYMINQIINYTILQPKERK